MKVSTTIARVSVLVIGGLVGYVAASGNVFSSRPTPDAVETQSITTIAAADACFPNQLHSRS
jgi:hypothetical protein